MKRNANHSLLHKAKNEKNDENDLTINGKPAYFRILIKLR